jgi:hypothetical protein
LDELKFEATKLVEVDAGEKCLLAEGYWPDLSSAFQPITSPFIDEINKFLNALEPRTAYLVKGRLQPVYSNDSKKFDTYNAIAFPALSPSSQILLFSFRVIDSGLEILDWVEETIEIRDPIELSNFLISVATSSEIQERIAKLGSLAITLAIDKK